MTQASDLAKFASEANALFNSITANTTAITAISVGGTSINSTSFAGTANNASNLGGTAAASYQLNSTLAANVATMAANSTTFANSSVTNTFTVGTAAYFVANGNVGIGTNTPVYKLDIYSASGDNTIASRSAASGAGIFRAVGANTTFAAYNALISTEFGGTQQWYLGGDGVANTIIMKTGTTERMRINSSGNVGIGNTSPGYPLTISRAGATDSYAQWTNDGGGNFIIGAVSSGDALLYNAANTAMVLNTNSLERMRIAANGFVGIGTNSPNATLAVTGTANVSSNFAVGGAISVAQSFTAISLNAAGSGFVGGTSGDNATSTVANVRLSSWFGIGFSPSITGQTVPYGENAAWINARSGDFNARGNITAYSSDRRLKKNFKQVENALEKVMRISGYEFSWDVEKCRALGFEPALEREHGFVAQEIQQIMPDATPIAPFDDAGKGESKTGENYLTVKYEKLVVLLAEAIKEQQKQIEDMKLEIKELKNGNFRTT